MEHKILELNKLSLFKDNEAGRITSLKWSVKNGYPRATVWINGADRSIKSYDNMIISPFTYAGLAAFTSTMADVIDAENGTEYAIQCFNTKFVDNKRTDEVELQSTMTIGKDKAGVIYLALGADGKPTVRFDLHVRTKWNKILLNGEDISVKAQGSKLFAKHYLKMVEKSIFDIMVEDRELYVPDNKMY